MTRRVKLIIDTDPGIDDAMAIFYATAAPDIELLGLTSIFGNVATAQATRNALRLLDWAGQDTVPVAHGADKPRALPAFPPSYNVHGDEGFGDMPAETPKGTALNESAAAFLTRMAREHKDELVLCPIGPLTNIAAALDLDPEFANNVGRIVLMGGSLDEGGNITHRILCTAEDFTAIKSAAPNLGGMINEMSRFYLEFYTTVGKFDGCFLHDPAAVIACTHPHLFTSQSVPVTVSCTGESAGATLRANDGRAASHVLMKTDAAAVKRQFMDVMQTLG